MVQWIYSMIYPVDYSRDMKVMTYGTINKTKKHKNYWEGEQLKESLSVHMLLETLIIILVNILI